MTPTDSAEKLVAELRDLGRELMCQASRDWDEQEEIIPILRRFGHLALDSAALIESQRATIERGEREKRAGDAASLVVAELFRLIPIPEVIKVTGTAGDLVEWFRAQSARVTALEAERAELVKALQPFASAAEEIELRERPKLDMHNIPPGLVLVRDLRHARQALSRSSTEVKNDG